MMARRFRAETTPGGVVTGNRKQEKENKDMTKRQLEIKYGVSIDWDSYWSPLRQRFVRAYKVYSADGCPWENGLRTMKDVEAECKKWADALLSIKSRCSRE